MIHFTLWKWVVQCLHRCSKSLSQSGIEADCQYLIVSGALQIEGGLSKSYCSRVVWTQGGENLRTSLGTTIIVSDHGRTTFVCGNIRGIVLALTLVAHQLPHLQPRRRRAALLLLSSSLLSKTRQATEILKHSHSHKHRHCRRSEAGCVWFSLKKFCSS